MMKFFFQLFVLIASFYVTSAAVAIALPHPGTAILFHFRVIQFLCILIGGFFIDFPGKCYDYTRTYNVGVYYPKDSCMKITCNRDFSMDFVSYVIQFYQISSILFYYRVLSILLLFQRTIYRCGTVGVPEGFRNVPDMSKRYPDCCINIVADEDFENIIE